MADDADDLRDDVAGLLNLNGVADAKPELADEVLVVEGRTGHRRTGKKDGVEAGRRGQHAGAAHSHLDAAQGRLLDLGRVLEGDGPPGKFVGGTHLRALGEIIDLDDCTVHVEVELRTVLADLLDLPDGILDVVDDMVAGRDRKAEALEVIEALCMGGQLFAPHLL